MPEDRRLAITSQRHVSPDDIARRTFGTVRRGFDPTEVRSFLDSVAEALRAAEDRIESLRQQVVEAEDRAANPVLDEETVASALGAETARVLRTAHEAAHDMVANAEAESERLRTSAHDAAADLEARTEAALAARTSEVDAALAELRHRAEAEAADTAASARAEAEALLEQTRDECRRMVEEAQALRARVLADLARRRKALHSQIDQLRAGRERLAETVRDVRRTIDSIAEEIFRAEDEARLAAEAAGRDATTPSGESAEADERGTPVLGGRAEEPAAEEPAATRTPGHTSRTASARSAEAVFAKIRAAREAGGAVRTADPAGTSPSPSPDDETRLSPDAPDGVTSAGTDASGEDPRPAGEAGAEQETARAVAGPPEATPPLALQRDELLAPVITALSRRLKRLLQDEQNDLLDRLRSARSRWSPELLPDAGTSGREVVVASLEHLRAAAEHGASLVVGQVGEADLVGDDLDQVADDLQRAILAPLRRRLESEQTFEPGDERGAAEHVGAAFRIWKAGRIEELATDHVLAAFALGTRAALAGRPDDHAVWIAVSGTERPPCPDCEDNALAGPTRVGDVFPTGHRSPPAHPGCRCLLAPAST